MKDLQCSEKDTVRILKGIVEGFKKVVAGRGEGQDLLGLCRSFEDGHQEEWETLRRLGFWFCGRWKEVWGMIELVLEAGACYLVSAWLSTRAQAKMEDF